MARYLIIGCGCRGRSLARELLERGHAVRGTTRDAGRYAAIEALGAEAVLADPDRIGTLARALDHVSVLCVLLGSAVGAPEKIADLHSTRLDMLLTRVLDTTVRGVVYEACGSVDAALLRAAADRVRAACERSQIPYAFIEADAGATSWLEAATVAAERVLGPGAAESLQER